MRRIAPLILLCLGASACGDEIVLLARPNQLPIAIAFIDNGPDNAAEQRLGYYIVDSTARLDASQSHDQDGTLLKNLTYRWTFDRLPTDDSGNVLSALGDGDIVLPPDDEATEDVNESSFASFVPDAVGTYRLSLTVLDDEDPAGESDPVVVTVQALPPSDLRVQLDWDDTRADLDLHLVAPDGSYFVDGQDCFSWYPSPDWGDPALANDNPALDEDMDGEGQGPYREGIDLKAPFEGDYQVYVHYYSDHAADLGLTPVSAQPQVDVTVFGQTILSDVAQPSAPLLAGDVWYVGIIRWPSMEFAFNGQVLDHTTDLNGPPYNEQL